MARAKDTKLRSQVMAEEAGKKTKGRKARKEQRKRELAKLGGQG